MKNSTDNPASDNPSDLEWLAFQYVSNELSETEQERFESLLSEKQSARDALVSATQLVSGLKSLEPLTSLETKNVALNSRQTVLTSRWAFRILLATSVALLLSVLPLLNKRDSQEIKTTPLVHSEPPTEDVEHMLSLWSESATESNVAVSLNSSTKIFDLNDQQNVLADNQSLEIPDWLYTAVSLPDESVN